MMTDINKIKGVCENLDNVKLIGYIKKYAIFAHDEYVKKQEKTERYYQYDNIRKAVEDELMKRLVTGSATADEMKGDD